MGDDFSFTCLIQWCIYWTVVVARNCICQVSAKRKCGQVFTSRSWDSWYWQSNSFVCL